MSEYSKIGVYTRGDDGFTFNYNVSLNAEQKMGFISDYANLVIIDGDYYSVVKNMMFKFMVIRNFTDVDTSFINDDDCENPINMIEDIVENTNIFDIVNANVEDGIIEELYESCELNIEYKTGIHRNLFDEAIGGLVKTFEKLVSNIDVDEMMKVGKMLGGISENLTPENILDAYAKSDMYKSNHGKDIVDTVSETIVSENVKKPKNKAKKNNNTTLQSPDYEA